MSARVVDFLGARVPEGGRVLIVDQGPLDLVAVLQDLGAQHVVDSLPGQSDLLVTWIGDLPPDDHEDGPPSRSWVDLLEGAAHRLAPGAPIVVMLGWSLVEVPLADLAAALALAGLAPVDVLTLRLQQAPVALVARRSEGEVAVSEWTATLGVLAAPALAEALSRTRAQMAGSLDDEDGAEGRSGARQTQALLRSRIKELEGLLARAERRQIELESSTKMRLGTALVDAAREPRRRRTLPRELASIWKGRDKSVGVAPSRGRQQVYNPPSDPLHHKDTSPRPRTRPVIAAVVADDSAQRLASAASIIRVMPHDDDDLLQRLMPEILLIESGAAQGSSPWRFLGDPAASDREVRLLALARSARESAIPVVLWRNTGPEHTTFLTEFAAECDLVVDGPESAGELPWSLGVDLAVARPAFEQGERSGIVFLGHADPSSGITRAQAATAAVAWSPQQTTVYADLQDDNVQHWLPPGVAARPIPARVGRTVVLAQHAVGIANPFGARVGAVGAPPETLEMLAAGLRVVTGPDDSLSSLLGPANDAMIVAEVDPAAAVEEALNRGPLSAEEHRSVLRQIFLNGAAGAALGRLVDLLGSVEHPGSARLVSVLAGPDPAQTLRAVLQQTWLPAEVLLPAVAEVPPGLVEEARASGVAVETLPDEHGGAGAASLAASSEWIVRDLERGGTNAVLDMLLALEVTGADGVGLDGGARISARTAPPVAPAVLWRDLA